MIHKVSDKYRIFDGGDSDSKSNINYLHGFHNADPRRLYAEGWILETSSDYDTNLEWLISIESAN